jgi:hypothetical protein
LLFSTERKIVSVASNQKKGMVTEVSTLRLYLLRAMYAFIAIGLGLMIWPQIVSPPFTADAKSVIRALLGALAVLAALGIRYPLKMLPLLLFELLWKVIWVAASALPMWPRQAKSSLCVPPSSPQLLLVNANRDAPQIKEFKYIRCAHWPRLRVAA